jgi:hypothetical protein
MASSDLKEGKFSVRIHDTAQAMESFLSTKQGGEVTTKQHQELPQENAAKGSERFSQVPN